MENVQYKLSKTAFSGGTKMTNAPRLIAGEFLPYRGDKIKPYARKPIIIPPATFDSIAHSVLHELPLYRYVFLSMKEYLLADRPDNKNQTHLIIFCMRTINNNHYQPLGAFTADINLTLNEQLAIIWRGFIQDLSILGITVLGSISPVSPIFHGALQILTKRKEILMEFAPIIYSVHPFPQIIHMFDLNSLAEMFEETLRRCDQISFLARATSKTLKKSRHCKSELAYYETAYHDIKRYQAQFDDTNMSIFEDSLLRKIKEEHDKKSKRLFTTQAIKRLFVEIGFVTTLVMHENLWEPHQFESVYDSFEDLRIILATARFGLDEEMTKREIVLLPGIGGLSDRKPFRYKIPGTNTKRYFHTTKPKNIFECFMAAVFFDDQEYYKKSLAGVSNDDSIATPDSSLYEYESNSSDSEQSDQEEDKSIHSAETVVLYKLDTLHEIKLLKNRNAHLHGVKEFIMRRINSDYLRKIWRTSLEQSAECRETISLMTAILDKLTYILDSNKQQLYFLHSLNDGKWRRTESNVASVHSVADLEGNSKERGDEELAAGKLNVSSSDSTEATPNQTITKHEVPARKTKQSDSGNEQFSWGKSYDDLVKLNESFLILMKTKDETHGLQTIKQRVIICAELVIGLLAVLKYMANFPHDDSPEEASHKEIFNTIMDEMSSLLRVEPSCNDEEKTNGANSPADEDLSTKQPSEDIAVPTSPKFEPLEYRKTLQEKDEIRKDSSSQPTNDALRENAEQEEESQILNDPACDTKTQRNNAYQEPEKNADPDQLSAEILKSPDDKEAKLEKSVAGSQKKSASNNAHNMWIELEYNRNTGSLTSTKVEINGIFSNDIENRRSAALDASKIDIFLLNQQSGRLRILTKLISKKVNDGSLTNILKFEENSVSLLVKLLHQATLILESNDQEFSSSYLPASYQADIEKDNLTFIRDQIEIGGQARNSKKSNVIFSNRNINISIPDAAGSEANQEEETPLPRTKEELHADLVKLEHFLAKLFTDEGKLKPLESFKKRQVVCKVVIDYLLPYLQNVTSEDLEDARKEQLQNQLHPKEEIENDVSCVSSENPTESFNKDGAYLASTVESKCNEDPATEVVEQSKQAEENSHNAQGLRKHNIEDLKETTLSGVLETSTEEPLSRSEEGSMRGSASKEQSIQTEKITELDDKEDASERSNSEGKSANVCSEAHQSAEGSEDTEDVAGMISFMKHTAEEEEINGNALETVETDLDALESQGANDVTESKKGGLLNFKMAISIKPAATGGPLIEDTNTNDDQTISEPIIKHTDKEGFCCTEYPNTSMSEEGNVSTEERCEETQHYLDADSLTLQGLESTESNSRLINLKETVHDIEALTVSRAEQTDKQEESKSEELLDISTLDECESANLGNNLADDAAQLKAEKVLEQRVVIAECHDQDSQTDTKAATFYNEDSDATIEDIKVNADEVKKDLDVAHTDDQESGKNNISGLTKEKESISEKLLDISTTDKCESVTVENYLSDDVVQLRADDDSVEIKSKELGATIEDSQMDSKMVTFNNEDSDANIDDDIKVPREKHDKDKEAEEAEEDLDATHTEDPKSTKGNMSGLTKQAHSAEVLKIPKSISSDRLVAHKQEKSISEELLDISRLDECEYATSKYSSADDVAALGAHSDADESKSKELEATTKDSQTDSKKITFYNEDSDVNMGADIKVPREKHDEDKEAKEDLDATHTQEPESTKDNTSSLTKFEEPTHVDGILEIPTIVSSDDLEESISKELHNISPLTESDFVNLHNKLIDNEEQIKVECIDKDTSENPIFGQYFEEPQTTDTKIHTTNNEESRGRVNEEINEPKDKDEGFYADNSVSETKGKTYAGNIMACSKGLIDEEVDIIINEEYEENELSEIAKEHNTNSVTLKKPTQDMAVDEKSITDEDISDSIINSQRKRARLQYLIHNLFAALKAPSNASDETHHKVEDIKQELSSLERDEDVGRADSFIEIVKVGPNESIPHSVEVDLEENQIKKSHEDAAEHTFNLTSGNGENFDIARDEDEKKKRKELEDASSNSLIRTQHHKDNDLDRTETCLTTENVDTYLDEDEKKQTEELEEVLPSPSLMETEHVKDRGLERTQNSTTIYNLNKNSIEDEKKQMEELEESAPPDSMMGAEHQKDTSLERTETCSNTDNVYAKRDEDEKKQIGELEDAPPDSFMGTEHHRNSGLESTQTSTNPENADISKDEYESKQREELEEDALSGSLEKTEDLKENDLQRTQPCTNPENVQISRDEDESKQREELKDNEPSSLLKETDDLKEDGLERTQTSTNIDNLNISRDEDETKPKEELEGDTPSGSLKETEDLKDDGLERTQIFTNVDNLDKSRHEDEKKQREELEEDALSGSLEKTEDLKENDLQRTQPCTNPENVQISRDEDESKQREELEDNEPSSLLKETDDLKDHGLERTQTSTNIDNLDISRNEDEKKQREQLDGDAPSGSLQETEALKDNDFERTQTTINIDNLDISRDEDENKQREELEVDTPSGSLKETGDLKDHGLERTQTSTNIDNLDISRDEDESKQREDLEDNEPSSLRKETEDLKDHGLERTQTSTNIDNWDISRDEDENKQREEFEGDTPSGSVKETEDLKENYVQRTQPCTNPENVHISSDEDESKQREELEADAPSGSLKETEALKDNDFERTQTPTNMDSLDISRDEDETKHKEELEGDKPSGSLKETGDLKDDGLEITQTSTNIVNLDISRDEDEKKQKEELEGDPPSCSLKETEALKDNDFERTQTLTNIDNLDKSRDEDENKQREELEGDPPSCSLKETEALKDNDFERTETCTNSENVHISRDEDESKQREELEDNEPSSLLKETEDLKDHGLERTQTSTNIDNWDISRNEDENKQREEFEGDTPSGSVKETEDLKENYVQRTQPCTNPENVHISSDEDESKQREELEADAPSGSLKETEALKDNDFERTQTPTNMDSLDISRDEDETKHKEELEGDKPSGSLKETGDLKDDGLERTQTSTNIDNLDISRAEDENKQREELEGDTPSGSQKETEDIKENYLQRTQPCTNPENVHISRDEDKKKQREELEGDIPSGSLKETGDLKDDGLEITQTSTNIVNLDISRDEDEKKQREELEGDPPSCSLKETEALKDNDFERTETCTNRENVHISRDEDESKKREELEDNEPSSLLKETEDLKDDGLERTKTSTNIDNLVISRDEEANKQRKELEEEEPSDSLRGTEQLKDNGMKRTQTTTNSEKLDINRVEGKNGQREELEDAPPDSLIGTENHKETSKNAENLNTNKDEDETKHREIEDLAPVEPLTKTECHQNNISSSESPFYENSDLNRDDDEKKQQEELKDDTSTDSLMETEHHQDSGIERAKSYANSESLNQGMELNPESSNLMAKNPADEAPRLAQFKVEEMDAESLMQLLNSFTTNITCDSSTMDALKKVLIKVKNLLNLINLQILNQWTTNFSQFCERDATETIKNFENFVISQNLYITNHSLESEDHQDHPEIVETNEPRDSVLDDETTNVNFTKMVTFMKKLIENEDNLKTLENWKHRSQLCEVIVQYLGTLLGNLLVSQSRKELPNNIVEKASLLNEDEFISSWMGNQGGTASTVIGVGSPSELVDDGPETQKELTIAKREIPADPVGDEGPESGHEEIKERTNDKLKQKIDEMVGALGIVHKSNHHHAQFAAKRDGSEPTGSSATSELLLENEYTNDHDTWEALSSILSKHFNNHQAEEHASNSDKDKQALEEVAYTEAVTKQCSAKGRQVVDHLIELLKNPVSEEESLEQPEGATEPKLAEPVVKKFEEFIDILVETSMPKLKDIEEGTNNADAPTQDQSKSHWKPEICMNSGSADLEPIEDGSQVNKKLKREHSRIMKKCTWYVNYGLACNSTSESMLKNYKDDSSHDDDDADSDDDNDSVVQNDRINILKARIEATMPPTFDSRSVENDKIFNDVISYFMLNSRMPKASYSQLISSMWISTFKSYRMLVDLLKLHSVKFITSRLILTDHIDHFVYSNLSHQIHTTERKPKSSVKYSCTDQAAAEKLLRNNSYIITQ